LGDIGFGQSKNVNKITKLELFYMIIILQLFIQPNKQQMQDAERPQHQLGIELRTKAYKWWTSRDHSKNRNFDRFANSTGCVIFEELVSFQKYENIESDE